MNMSLKNQELKSFYYDEFAEQILLGAMLIDNKYANDVFTVISPSDFFKNSNQKIAIAIYDLINDDSIADIVTIAGHLDRTNNLKIAGGHEYIITLLDIVPENVDITEYIKTILTISTLRQLILNAADIIIKEKRNR